MYEFSCTYFAQLAKEADDKLWIGHVVKLFNHFFHETH